MHAPPPPPPHPGPRPEPPPPPPDDPAARMRDAMTRGDYAEALSLAEQRLRDAPNDHQALVSGALAACRLHRPRIAHGMIERVPEPRRAGVYQACMQEGIDLQSDEMGEHHRRHRRGGGAERDEE